MNAQHTTWTRRRTLVRLVLASLWAGGALSHAAEVPPVGYYTQSVLESAAEVRKESKPYTSRLGDVISTTGAVTSVQEKAYRDYAEQRRNTLDTNTARDPNSLRRQVRYDDARRGYNKRISHVNEIANRGKSLENAGKTLGFLNKAGLAVEVGDAVARGDYGAAATIVGQELTETAVDKIGTQIATSVCGPMCAGSFQAGQAVGTVIDRADTCVFLDCKPGTSYSVEDGVTDVYYYVAEAVDHFWNPENDPMSQAFKDKFLRKREQNRAQYQQTSNSLIEEQRQLDAQRVSLGPVYDDPPSPGANDFADTLLGTLMQGVLLYQGLNEDGLPVSQTPAEDEPCHDGHNEEKHPGGCHGPPIKSPK